jgi:hypothetical protein
MAERSLIEVMLVAALEPDVDRYALHAAFAGALETLTVHADDGRQVARIHAVDAVRPLGEIA